jgi:glycosyltransferase involved in cell wall biosynthesis
MVLMEAIARGLPVVSTTGGAIPFTVPPDAAILVPPGDAKALADALRHLLTDDAHRERLAAAARRHAGEFADWDVAARSFAAAVDALTS